MITRSVCAPWIYTQLSPGQPLSHFVLLHVVTYGESNCLLPHTAHRLLKTQLRWKYLVTQAKLFLGCTTTWEQPMVQKAASYIEINAVVTACVNFFKNVCGSASPSIHVSVTRFFLHELCLGMRLPQCLASHTLLRNVNRRGVGLFLMVRGPIFGRLQYNRSLMNCYARRSIRPTYPSCVESPLKMRLTYNGFNLLLC